MKISLNSDKGPEDVQKYINKFSRIKEKYTERLRNTLEKEKEKFGKTRKIITINELERQIKSIFGDEACFKEGNITNSFYLKQEDNLDFPGNRDSVYYLININTSAGYIEFKIEPENLELDTKEILNLGNLIKSKPDRSNIYNISEEDIDKFEKERELEEFELQLSLFEKNLKKYTSKEKLDGKTTNIMETLEEHKNTVLNLDYVLRKFARENRLEYKTNHSFQPLEDKNQLKLEYPLSQ